MESWFHSTILAGLLLTAYLWAWTPVRTAWTNYGSTLLEQVVSATGSDASVSGRSGAHTLQFRVDDERTVGYAAPAGMRFLLPAGFLLLVAPRRPHLGLFFLGHLGLGLLGLSLLLGEAAGLPGSLELTRFIHDYAVEGYSLAVPVFVFVQRSA
jgi:hypothetical protein